MSKLPDYQAALKQALQCVKSIKQTKSIDLAKASDRVLAEPVTADRNLPPFNRAQMDGYAIRAVDFVPGKAWPVSHIIAAGTSPDVQVPAGHCVAIATGAALPRELDTVIQHEHSDRGDQTGQPVRFTVDSVTVGQAVHRCGADAKAGDTLVAPGTVLAAHHLAIAAAVGKTALRVRAKPRAAVLTSGDEVLPPETPLDQLQMHQIRNSNGILIRNLLRQFGAQPLKIQHVEDNRADTLNAVRKAVRRCDLVVTVGGVSAGDRDFFSYAFKECHVEASLHGAAIQPGRPIVAGVARNGTIVIALPGNPVSALACACLFAWPVVRAMLGIDANLPWREVTLAQPAKPNASRRAFRPAIIQDDGQAVVPPWAGSGDLAHTAPTHGLLELPVQREEVPAGTRLRFLPWP